MNINMNTLNKIFTSVSIASMATMTGCGLAMTIKECSNGNISTSEGKDIDGTIELSVEEFAAMQEELESLRNEIEEFKTAEQSNEAARTTETSKPDEPTPTPEITTLNPIPEPLETSSHPPVSTLPEAQTPISEETKTQPGTRSDINLKELNMETLNQSEAYNIWKSYLLGNCEYDLNANNLAEFCQKFGFDINLAK